jgi:2,5-dioxopentanoate dehydrogenase
MPPKGEMLIGSRATRGAGEPLRAFDPVTGSTLEPAFGTATSMDLDASCVLAAAAFPSYRDTPLEQRARFLETIARKVANLGTDLVERACVETGLPRGRIEGERDRTTGQLKLFATVVRDGGFLDARIDAAIPDRKPMRRPDIRMRQIGVGPVAVFSASNFPLAFSVAGGDTAAALAAGCPVIVKGHSAHPGTSELVGRAIRDAVREHDFPEGVFSLLFGRGAAIGAGLVADARIKAVGFTGSRVGGMALLKIAQQRPEPIPVFAEMSSVNPVVLLPDALRLNAAGIAKNFVAALTLGAGQFCTNPGLLLAIDGPELDTFLRAASEAVSATPAAAMLTPGIHGAYAAGVQRLSDHPGVTMAACGSSGGPYHGRAALFSTDAATWFRHRELSEEMFGAAALVVRCRDMDELRSALSALEGQLTVAIHMADADIDFARTLLPVLEDKAGRIVANGFGTGVEVGHAIVHGGPFPSTSDARMTSVGSLSIRRFLRPVAYQDLPDALLPDSLRDGNPLGIPRLIDGKPSK